MTDEHKELLLVELKSRFYYVVYPDPLPFNIWQDRGGELHYLSEMTLDHLKNTIQLLQKDLRYLENSHRPKPVVNAIMPVAAKILLSLKEEFDRKSVI